jgi:RNA polymerase sigma-54 factor
VLITKKDDGSFGVEINNAALPRVLVDKKYYTEVTAGTKDKEEKKYLSQKWQSANFIVRALEQRAETMLKTSAAIVKYQNEFFRFGIKYLKPLTLAQIAAEIEMHESTISRVTSNKYMQTPRGNFEMKYFFTSGVSNSGGEVASTSVKEMIREMIAAEDHKKPLSDDALTKMLGKKGIKISRRTVMKYREAMGIESSYERKNQLVTI